jgi:type I restriction enzyme, S subunit
LPDEEIVDSKTGFRYLRAQDLNEGEITSKETIFVSEKYFDSIKRSHIRSGSFLFSIMGSIGNSAVVPENFTVATANRAVGILVPRTGDVGWSNYLFGLFLTGLGIHLFEALKKGGLQKRVNLSDIENLEIPTPPIDIRDTLIVQFEAARASRREKLARADELLNGLDAWLLEKLGIVSNEKRQKIFSIKKTQLDDALNPERYAGLVLEKNIKGCKIIELGEVIAGKITPSGLEIPVWDRIRIDDLSNQPLGIDVIKTEAGDTIEGSFFEVQENDVLLARLGPTIQNAKFVIVPKLIRRTIASAEFLVLRCNKDWHPEAVLAVLRTKLFRDLMYSKSRGATPSRYRLNAEDFRNLPFPLISEELQEDIIREVRSRHLDVKRLRIEAEGEWQAAKQHFENQLLDNNRVTL